MLALSAAAIACASRPPAPCDPVPVELSMVNDAPVFRDCAVDRKAGLPRTIRHDYRPTRAQACGFVTTTFVVDTLGRVVQSTITVTETNDRDFADAFVAALPSARFTPARKDEHPVQQLVEYGNVYQMVAVTRSRPGSVARANARRC